MRRICSWWLRRTEQRAAFHVSAAWRAPGDSGFQCSACGKSFRLINALNHHIATRHAGQAKALTLDTEGKVSGEASTSQSSVPKPAVAATKVPSAAPSTAASTGTVPKSMGFSPFPGMSFGGSVGTAAPAPAAASAAPKPSAQPSAAVEGEGESPAEAAASSDAPEKKLFVCTICQKTFRLEAALQHHYQAKHGMEMPGSSIAGSTAFTKQTGSFPSSATSAFGIKLSSQTSTDENTSSFGTQYTRVGEGALPSVTQYHLDVAPNAPEEGDIAAHWRLVNHCMLLGSVSDISDGYVFEDRVLQFVVATEFDNPSPGDPDKDFHTVRVYGEGPVAHWLSNLNDGDRVMIAGRLRLVPQFDTITNKYYHHPVVLVPESGGSVTQM